MRGFVIPQAPGLVRNSEPMNKVVGSSVLSCVLVLLSVLLAACGDIPQPFRHDGPNLALAPSGARGVVVRPPDDDSPISPRIAEAIVRRLLEAEVPASTRPVVNGAWTMAAETEKTPAATVLRWSLVRSNGEVLASLTQTIPTGPWTRATAKTVEIIAAEVVDKLSGPLHGPADAIDAYGVPPSMPGIRPPVVRLLPLTGLPGDGNQALAAAMRHMLEQAGMVMATGDDKGELVVRGQVTLSPGRPGEDVLALAWVVSRPDGAELGSAAQQGALPKGRLDQPWGSLAAEIAAAGADGIAGIVRAAGKK